MVINCELNIVLTLKFVTISRIIMIVYVKVLRDTCIHILGKKCVYQEHSPWESHTWHVWAGSIGVKPESLCCVSPSK